jgi:acetylornithine deacetylase/succinyl-diaminopimelate desuccinylase family protein
MLTKKTDVLRFVDSQNVITLAQQLVRIPSENPPGSEHEIAGFVQDVFQKMGLETSIVEAEKGRSNVIAKYNVGHEPVLILNGHADVVPAGDGWRHPPYDGVTESGRLYGRGAADMKGGLAAAISAVDAVVHSDVKLNGSLTVSVVADEEAGGRLGTGFLVEKGILKGDMAIVCEPSDFKLSVSEGGGVWFDIQSYGRSAHTIEANYAINPVEKMAKFVVALEKVKKRLSAYDHPKYGRPILSMNTISGGTKVNVVPEICRGSLDFRFPPGVGITPKKAIALIQKVVNDLHEADKNLRIKLDPTIIAHPFEQPENTRIVRIVKDSAKTILGKTPKWWRKEVRQPVVKSDDSDVYHLWTKGNIPSVYFGPGKIRQCHAIDEYVEIKQIIDATKIYALAILGALTDLP